MSKPIVRVIIPDISHSSMEAYDLLGGVKIDAAAFVAGMERKYPQFKFEVTEESVVPPLVGDALRGAEELHMSFSPEELAQSAIREKNLVEKGYPAGAPFEP